AGNDGSRPSPDTRQYGDVLMAVRATIGDWLADDPRRRLELPEQVAGRGADRLEPAFHRAIEHHVASRCQRPAPDRKILLDLPGRPLIGYVPGGELATVAARARDHPHFHADIGRTGDVVHVHTLLIHAKVGVRNVEEPGARRE